MKFLTESCRKIVGNRYFDFVVFVLIFLSVALLGVEIALPSDHPQFQFVEASGDLITCFFVIELLIRFIASRRKKRFFSEYFIDILAVLPLFRAFRFLRFLRLLRLLRLFRAVSMISRQTRLLQWLFKQRLTEYLITVVLLIFATLFGTLGLSHFRRPFDSGSDVLVQSFWETVFSLVAGEYVDSFPETLGAKIVILFVQFCGLTFFALLTGTVSAVMIEKLKEGTVLSRLMLEDLENHILICGYNAGVETIISEFQNHPQFKEREIVIITEHVENPVFDNIPFPARVRTVQEDFTRVDVMNKCNINTCAVALIVSDISGGRSRQDADARTVLAALTIEKLNPAVHTCAELSDAHSESHLRMGGVNEVIVTRSTSGHLLAQAALYSCNVHLLQNLLKPTQGHTFRPMVAKDEYVGKQFAEVLVIHHKAMSTILIAVEKTDGELLINPKDYVIAEGDQLICIAPYDS